MHVGAIYCEKNVRIKTENMNETRRSYVIRWDAFIHKNKEGNLKKWHFNWRMRCSNRFLSIQIHPSVEWCITIESIFVWNWSYVPFDKITIHQTYKLYRFNPHLRLEIVTGSLVISNECFSFLKKMVLCVHYIVVSIRNCSISCSATILPTNFVKIQRWMK